jgi:PAS domain S-box-containing protein
MGLRQRDIATNEICRNTTWSHRAMKFNIKNKILFGNAVTMALVIVLGLTSLSSFKTLVETSEWEKHTHQVMQNIATIEKLVVDLETSQRGFLIAGKEEFLEPFESGKVKITSQISKTRKLVSDNPLKVERLNQIEKEITRWQREAGQPEIEKRRDVEKHSDIVSNFEKLHTRTVGKEIFDDIRFQFKEIRSNLDFKNSLKGNVHLLEMFNSLLDMETGQRGYLLTGREDSLKPYLLGKNNFEKSLVKLKQFLKASQKNQTVTQNINRIEFLVKQWENKAATPEILARRAMSSLPSTMNDVTDLIKTETGKNIMDSIRLLLQATMQEEQRLMASRSLKTMQEKGNSELIIILGTLIVLISSLIWSWWFGNNFSQPLLHVVEKIQEISQGNVQQSKIDVHRNDEVGTLQRIMNHLSENLSTVVHQAETISKGDLENKIEVRSEKDLMATSLNQMVDTLRIQKSQANIIIEKEAHLSAFIETSVDAIITIDEIGTVQSVSSAMKNMFGYEPSEVLGKNIKMLMPEPYHSEHDGYLRNYMTTGTAKIIGFGREVIGKRKDSSTFPMDLSIAELWVGEKRLFSGTARDITESKIQTTRIMEKEAHLSAVIESSVDAIITIDEIGMVQSVSSATEKMFGYEPSEVLGKNIKMLMPEPYHSEHDGYLENYMTTGKAKIIGFGREVIGKRKDNSTFPMDLSVAEMWVGEKRLFSGIARDITERKEAEAEMKELTETLLQASEKDKRNEWFIQGQNQLDDTMRGDFATEILAQQVITFLTKYLDAQIGVIYLVDEKGTELKLSGSYALTKHKKPDNGIKIGEGLVGQAAYEKELISITNIPEDYTRISSATGNTPPRNVIVTPFISNKSLIGVIELASIEKFSNDKINFLKGTLESIAIVFSALQANEKRNVLLEETQRQAEELESQQEELRQTNEELSDKAISLDKQKTEIQAKNQEIEQKAEDLALSSKYKSEFLANMSHELRTPLNSMLLLSNSLLKNKEGNLKSDQVESMSIIYNGGKSLLNLINEILDLSKIEAGMTSIETEEVSIKEIAQDIQTNFAHMAEEKGLELSIQVNENLSDSIVTDQTRLNQILKNFLSNAIKFTEKGKVGVEFKRPSIDINLSKSGLDPKQVIAIAVTDSGIGIPSDKQRLIFEAFQQADGGTSRKYGGTGLGLSISRELTELLGGEIQVQSESGIGSTFTLYLPLQLSYSQTQEKPQESSLQRSPISKPKLKTQEIALNDDRDNLDTNSKSTLLIIEDDLNFSKILKDQCASKSLKCILASSGEEGLDLANQFLPKGIILDINLPGIDGWFVLNALKDNPRTRHIPVHIMSIDDFSTKGAQKGAIGYLSKPVSQDKLDAAFTRLQTFTDKKIKNLLVVEDDEMTQKGIYELIQCSDVKITAVSSGKEAIKSMDSNQFDCMILDLKLPDMTGFELLDKLEKDLIPPVIVYTGKELTRKENKQLLTYADSVIVKGVHSEERLLDETSLFLHQVIEELPQEKQAIIHDLHNIDNIFKGKKIMVVDDDMRNIFAISRLLQEKGIETIKADSGQIALDNLKETSNIDMVLMDIMMPEMDGYEATQKIRQQKQFKGLPIIALTAKAMSGDREKCIEAGASDYISKPVEEERLFSMMRIWLYK